MRYVLRLICLALLYVITLFDLAAFAQNDIESKSLPQELWPITNTGFYPSKDSDAALWYAQGSIWVLDIKGSTLPAELKTYLERFTWHQTGWSFETPHCYPQNSGFRKEVFTASFDFERKKVNQSVPVVFTQKMKSFSKSRPAECSTFENRDSLGTISGAFHLSWRLPNPNDLTRIMLRLILPSGEEAQLKYNVEKPFERLTQTDWQMDLTGKNLGSYCGYLRVSPLGRASTSCCNGLAFEIKENETGWASNSGGGTQVACGAERMAVDNQFYAAMREGLKLDSDGQLIIGTTPETVITMKPVDRFQDMYGSWILSDLEMRSMNMPIRTLPNVNSIKSRQALLDEDIRLELTPKQLTLSSSCAKVEVPIVNRKGEFLRLGERELTLAEGCKRNQVNGNKLFRIFPQISANQATLYGTHNLESGVITLTRVQLGSNYRSVSWVFSPTSSGGHAP